MSWRMSKLLYRIEFGSVLVDRLLVGGLTVAWLNLINNQTKLTPKDPLKVKLWSSFIFFIFIKYFAISARINNNSQGKQNKFQYILTKFDIINCGLDFLNNYFRLGSCRMSVITACCGRFFFCDKNFFSAMISFCMLM